MSFWGPTISHDEAARLKRLYEEMGSLQAVADAENVRTRWLGRVLLAHDRRVAGSDRDYAGPERRKA
ncbi:hypothetical protein [Sphingobium fluviale]|uniref:Uncharacterized protein n=1 Tax=Sphingobium fluviale TaxID=2506423 RepID=A0A4Q1KEX6_9SPHN|nr:hypothetical protein [Sphingobium fluviale]RXR28213.1 hypothetical protein EQG66_10665 [Sphingobium fluviale]